LGGEYGRKRRKLAGVMRLVPRKMLSPEKERLQKLEAMRVQFNHMTASPGIRTSQAGGKSCFKRFLVLDEKFKLGNDEIVGLDER
jgi:hypothetical protein